MISVAIPAYKKEYLKEAIDGVLNQTYKDLELIIVDDASPYELNKIVDQFSDSRIKYYRNNTNLGKDSLVNNWNKCLEYAKGDYFVLFSDDDLMDQNFLLRMVELTEKYPENDIFHCRVRVIDNKGKTISYTPTKYEVTSALEFIWHRIKGFGFHYAPEFFVKTKKLRELGGFQKFPLAWCSDDATWIKVALENGLIYSNEALISWRQSDINISSSGSLPKRLEALQSFKVWLDELLNAYQAQNKLELDLLEDTKSNLNKYINNLKFGIILQTAINKRTGLYSIFYNWIKYHRKYNLSFTLVFLKSILSYLKFIFTKKSIKLNRVGSENHA